MQRLGGRLAPDDAVWEQHLAQTAAFVAEHGRFPLQREGGKWLLVQRSLARHRRLDPHREHRLDVVLPGWQIGREHRWWARLGELEAFVAEHGRRPRVRSKDPHESTLGQWLETQLGGSGRASRDPSLRARLLLLLPEDDGRATIESFTVRAHGMPTNSRDRPPPQ